jgi:putative membrane protein
MAGVVLGVVNLLIRPVLLLLTIPINILTLGLFTLVINTLMVMLTDTLVESLDIPGFGVAFLIALMVYVLNMFFAGTEKNR